jgi:CDP-diacylglycerol--glycerol-3-phosphate 3-phosphatidyltransferase
MQLSFDAADRLVELVHARHGPVDAEEASRVLFAIERAPVALARSLLADVVEGDARLAWLGTRVGLAGQPHLDTPIEEAELVVFDLETTGLSARSCRAPVRASHTARRPLSARGSGSGRCSAAFTRASRTPSPASSRSRCWTRCSPGRRSSLAPDPRAILGAPVFPLNLPNTLTVIRILLVPVVVVALVEETPNGDAIAAGVFALAALTDTLDGYIARRRDAVTTFGKLMDPIADKLLIAASLIALVSLDRLAAWIAMVIIAREFAVTGLRMVAVERGVVIQASWLGKLKTTLQVAAIICLIAFDPAPLSVDLLVYAAVAATVISGIDYFFGFRRMHSKQAGVQADGA